jgi:hypothetical protein
MRGCALFFSEAADVDFAATCQPIWANLGGHQQWADLEVADRTDGIADAWSNTAASKSAALRRTSRPVKRGRGRVRGLAQTAIATRSASPATGALCGSSLPRVWAMENFRVWTRLSGSNVSRSIWEASSTISDVRAAARVARTSSGRRLSSCAGLVQG